MTLSGATTPGHGRPGNDGNEGVLCFLQSSSIAGISLSYADGVFYSLFLLLKSSTVDSYKNTFLSTIYWRPVSNQPIKRSLLQSMSCLRDIHMEKKYISTATLKRTRKSIFKTSILKQNGSVEEAVFTKIMIIIPIIKRGKLWFLAWTKVFTVNRTGSQDQTTKWFVSKTEEWLINWASRHCVHN